MPKRVLSASQSFEMRQVLHVAVLDALIQSRRWEPGDIAFQGGTCLHLVHGSPRYSEDLDFMVSSALKLQGLKEAMLKRLKHAAWIPSDMQISVSKDKPEAGRNPHAFTISVAGSNVIGAVKVKTEFWQCPQTALSSLALSVQPVRSHAWSHIGGGQVFTPSLTEHEIYVDKVFAVGARPYLKPRDIFDLEWIRKQGHPMALTQQDLLTRLAIYPNAQADEWITQAHTRMSELPSQAQTIRSDLHKWIPSSMKISDAELDQMIQTTQACLTQGIDTMASISNTTPTPPRDR